jgi:EmrB/QacA subfamily drug resistance transporter
LARKWWTLTGVCIGTFMLLLDVTIVNVALPDIERAFKASLSDLQWVVDAYALTLAALLLTAGSIADLAGRRIVFAIGVVIFTASSVLCGAAPSSSFLSISRALQGVGGAIMFATSLALLAQAFRPAERGVAFAIFGAVTGMAVAIGPVLGGVIIAVLSWRWIFFVNLPIGAIALAITLARVEESKLAHAPRPDLPGFVCFSVAGAGLVFGLIRSQSEGWGTTEVAGPMILAAVLLAAFVLIELRTSEPMLDLRLLRVPTFNGGLVAAFAVSGSVIALLTYLTIYLQDILGYSALQAGIRFLPFSGGTFILAALAGRLTTKVPIRLLIGGGFALVTVALLLMRGLAPGDRWTHFLPGFILAGAATAFINVPLASTAVGVVPAERAGMASGINSTARQVGLATGVAGLGTILASRITGQLAAHLAGTPLASDSHRLASSFAASGSGGSGGGLSPHLQAIATAAVRASYVDALNTVLLVAAIVAAIATVVAFLTIRGRDFHPGPQEVRAESASEGSEVDTLVFPQAEAQ